MALGRIKGITIELNVDGDKAIRKLDEFERAANRVGTSLKDINKVLKLNPASTEALSQKQKALASQVQATTQQLKMEEQALKQLEGGEQTEKTVKQQERLKLQIEETRGKLAACKQEYQAFGSVGVQQLKLVGEQMTALGDSMINTGRNLTRHVTAPIAALGGIAVKELADFEQGMAKVGAVSQASGEQVEEMSAYARNLAATTKFTAGEVTEAYNYMALAGWKPQEMMEGLEGTLNLVAASGEELGTVSDILTDGLTAFGYSAQEAGRFGDVLAVAMSHSNTTVGQLGEAFKYIGPVAGAMGYEVEDLAVALGTMANAGIKGSTAGTTLRNILTNLAKPTDEMAGAMEVLGVRLDDGQGNMLSFQKVMEQFRSGLGGIKIPLEDYRNELNRLDADLEEGTITNEDYMKAVVTLSERAFGAEGALMAQYAASIAGKRGMAGLMAIVTASDEDWNSLTQSINNADGAAEGMRETMENTLSGQLTILKSQLAELAMQFGEVLMPKIKELVEWLQNLAIRFQEMAPETKEMIVRIAAIAAAIGPLLLVGGKLVKGMGTLLKMPAKLTAGMAKVRRTMLLLKTAISLPSVAILGIVAAIGVLIAAFMTLWKKNENFRKAITGIWERIKKSGEKLFKGLGVDVTKLVENFKKAWAWFTDKMAPYFINAIDMVARAFDAAVDVILGIVKVFKAAFSGDWKGLWEGVKQVLKGALDFIKSIVNGTFNAVKEIIRTIWNAIGTWISKKITDIKDTFSKTFTAIKDYISAVWTYIEERWKFFWNGIENWITGKLNGIKKKFTDAFTSVRDYISAVWTYIDEKWKFFWNGIENWITGKLNGIKKKFTDAFQAVRDYISAVWTYIDERWKFFWNGIENWITGKLNGIKKKFTDAFDGIKEKVNGVWTSVKDKITTVWTDIGTWISDKVGGIKDSIVDKFTTIKTSISDKMSDIWEKIKEPFEKAYEKVEPIIQKIKDLFPIKIGNAFSGLKLPKIEIVSYGKAPWGLFGKGYPPELDFSWHKDAMAKGIIMNKPTIFGMEGNTLHGAGEAGSETLVGTGSLMSMIQSAVRQNSIDPALIYEAVRQGASDATIKAYLSGKDITSAVNSNITLAQSYSARFQGV